MKKGQAALEFLMTYGWAILVVLAAIAALAYFGILNPGKFTPDTCIASSGLGCLGKPLISTDTVDISFGSGLGYDVNLVGTNASNNLGCTSIAICPLGNTSCLPTDVTLLKDGSGATVHLSNCTFNANANIIKGELTINYTNAQSRLGEKMLLGITGKKG